MSDSRCSRCGNESVRPHMRCPWCLNADVAIQQARGKITWKREYMGQFDIRERARQLSDPRRAGQSAGQFVEPEKIEGWKSAAELADARGAIVGPLRREFSREEATERIDMLAAELATTRAYLRDANSTAKQRAERILELEEKLATADEVAAALRGEVQMMEKQIASIGTESMRRMDRIRELEQEKAGLNDLRAISDRANIEYRRLLYAYGRKDIVAMVDERLRQWIEDGQTAGRCPIKTITKQQAEELFPNPAAVERGQSAVAKLPAHRHQRGPVIRCQGEED